MRDLEERFERNVDRSGQHHIWTGAKDPDRGTGRIKVAGRSTAAHRVAWEVQHGPIPASAAAPPTPSPAGGGRRVTTRASPVSSSDAPCGSRAALCTRCSSTPNLPVDNDELRHLATA